MNTIRRSAKISFLHDFFLDNQNDHNYTLIKKQVRKILL